MLSSRNLINNLCKINTIFMKRFASSDSSLAKLRRKTGYAFSLCRKALEIHEQDIEKAEQWLKVEAVKQGWERAQKVKSRATGEGLIGVITTPDKRLSAMIEVNCETDFVARNQLFTELVSSLTKRLSEKPIQTQHSDNGNVSKIRFGSEELSQLAPEVIVEAIGKLGENIKLSKASLVLNNKVEDNVQLVGYTHAVGGKIATNEDSVLLGKYGTIIALKAGLIVNEEGLDATKTPEEVEEIGKQLAQHIIGLNPTTIEPKSEIIEEEPTSLLQQQFIFDEDFTVAEFLKEANVSVLDFERFECGLNE